jgi:uracil phosphoribosyltransferase
MIHNLGLNNSIINQYISEIRDVEVQKDSMRFRNNMIRLGEIFAYEISKMLDYSDEDVVTSLGVAKVPTLLQQPVLATILRAGLPLHQGLLNFFDHADNAFISAYRRHYNDGTFEIKIDYLSSPLLENRILILADPMLATGQSMALTYKEIVAANGKPKHTHIVSAIASAEGVEYLKRQMPMGEFTFWTAAVDEELTAQSYIVPGLGDAGDLAFGAKSTD